MPTTYAHDLFGKIVYQKLDKEIQEIIQPHKMSYIVGLHGPDILFYVQPFRANRINQIGYRMHRETAAEFFERGARLYREGGDDGVLAYLLGFVCHFMLDSTCHPYIRDYMEKTGARHDEIETELDGVLMRTTGKNPYVYHPSRVIRPTRDCVRSISAVLGEVSEREVRHMLRAMKFYTNITVCATGLKRKALFGLAKLVGAYPYVKGRVILKHPRPVCGQSTEELMRLFRLAIPETVTVVEEYYRCVRSGEEISFRFHRNYE